MLMRQSTESNNVTKSAYPLRAQLDKICQSVQIEAVDTFTIAGTRFVTTVPSEGSADDASPDHATALSVACLIEKLTGQLYECCYVRSLDCDAYAASDELREDFREQSIDEQSIDENLTDEDLTASFHTANDNKDGWDPGWQIYQTGSDGRLFVQKGDRSRAVLAGEYSTYKWPGVAPVAGDFVSVRMFAGSTDVQPSFFFAFGRTLSDQFDEYAIVRFYFHVSAQQAPNLMAQITADLNRYQIPFKFKALIQAKLYTRKDAAVLYVARRYYPVVAMLLIDMQRDGAICLKEGNPLFTRTLSPGIGIAEDPKAGVSFGMHRCNLLARGLAKAWQKGVQDCRTKMQAIEDEFVANQLSLDCAYLNPGSTNFFEAQLFDKETQW
jgi:hypothetical protein